MMDWNSPLVLVTGAAGWLGTNLLRALFHGLPECPNLPRVREGTKVRCLILSQYEREKLIAIDPSIETVWGDLKNLRDCEELCKSAQGAILFHIAGVIHPQRIAEFYEVNVRGSINLLQAAAKFGVQRVIVISSNSPFGCNPHPDHLFDETSSYHPYLNYGRSKMEMEKLVSAMQASGAVETVIVRPPWFYGPNQPLRQTLFFTMIRDGKVPIVGSGESLRSMAYVDNIVQGMLLAAIVPNANGQAYWIADERPYSMREIVDTIEDVLEREFGKVCRRKRLRLPNIISSIAYAMDSTIQAVGFYNQKLHVLSEMNKTIACSIAKARRDLGFDPKIELREGMRRSIASVQASI